MHTGSQPQSNYSSILPPSDSNFNLKPRQGGELPESQPLLGPSSLSSFPLQVASPARVRGIWLARRANDVAPKELTRPE